MSVSRSITAATAATSHTAAAIPIMIRIRSLPEFLDLPIFSSPRRSLLRRSSHYPTTRDPVGYWPLVGWMRRDETDGDGLIVAERQYWNMLELLAQLGMFVPMPEG